MTSVVLQEWRDNCHFLKKNRTQVETLVRPAVSPKSGELKLGRKRPHRLMGRFSDKERAVVMAKANSAGLSINEYLRASVLGSNYKPPINPALHQALLMLNRELTAHGRNLNQIAKRLNSRMVNPDEGISSLEAIRAPLTTTLATLKLVLTRGALEP